MEMKSRRGSGVDGFLRWFATSTKSSYSEKSNCGSSCARGTRCSWHCISRISAKERKLSIATEVLSSSVSASTACVCNKSALSTFAYASTSLRSLGKTTPEEADSKLRAKEGIASKRMLSSKVHAISSSDAASDTSIGYSIKTGAQREDLTQGHFRMLPTRERRREWSASLHEHSIRNAGESSER